MKKVLWFLFILSLASTGHSSIPIIDPMSVADVRKYLDDYKKEHYPYTGPHDTVVITGCKAEYRIARDATTLGQLAQTSDMIGIGRVEQTGWSNFVVRVDTALVGCTNGQLVTLSWAILKNETTFYKRWKDVELNEHTWVDRGYEFPDPPLEYLYGLERWRKPMAPDKDSQIVFSVVSSATSDQVPPVYCLLFNERSWWPVERENGFLTEHFKEVVRAARTHPSGKKYFYLCRDGMYKDSIRVKEDSYYDMRGIIRNATTNQAHFIYNDPLVLPEHKAYLLQVKPYVQ